MVFAAVPRSAGATSLDRRSMKQEIGYARFLFDGDAGRRSARDVTRPESDALEWPDCPRCGSNEAQQVLEGRDFLYGTEFHAVVSECPRCGLWYQRPRLPSARHVELYPSGYLPHGEAANGTRLLHPVLREYLKRSRGYTHLAAPSLGTGVLSHVLRGVLHWRVGVALIPAYIGNGRVLDIGCGSGGMLAQLSTLGWKELHGIEPDPEAAELARSTGADVRCGTVEDVLPHYPDAHFDAIIASMVVEHVGNPYAVVRSIARKLKPGGELLLSTVTRDSVQAAFFGEYWAGFDFPRHMVYFRNADVAALLADDFERIEWFNQIAPIDWIRSATWRGRRSDIAMARVGKLGWLVPSVVVAAAGRSTRISVRSRRKANSRG